MIHENRPYAASSDVVHNRSLRNFAQYMFWTFRRVMNPFNMGKMGPHLPMKRNTFPHCILETVKKKIAADFILFGRAVFTFIM